MIAPEDICKNTPRKSKQTSKKRKSLTTHWSGVEVTYYATTTINIFIKILQTKQSLRLFTAVTNYRVFINRSHRFDKKVEIPGAVLEKLSQARIFYRKKGRTMFELVRRIHNIDVFKKKQNRAATDLVE